MKYIYTILLINLISLTNNSYSQEGRSTFKQINITKVPKPTAPANLNITSITFDDSFGNSNNIIDANEKSTLKFNISNLGKGKAYNIQVSIKSTSVLNDINIQSSYVAGELESGQSKLVIININSGQNTIDGFADFTINATEANGFNPDERSIKIPTQKFINPIVLITDNKFSLENGGQAVLGVPINLKIGVQNKGQGVAKKVKVKFIMPLENVYSTGIDVFEIEELKAGEGKIIDFEFFANKRYIENNIPINVLVSEQYGKFGDNQTYKVSLFQSLQKNSQVVISGIKQSTVSINELSLLSDVDKNIPKTKTINNNSFAIVIGNSNYYKAKPIDYAINDARSMKDYLVNSLGFKEGNIIFKENATLGDFNTIFGTKDNPKGQLSNIIKKDISDVFIFYSGHGAPGLKDNRGYFVPVECDPNYIENSGYPLDIFYNNLSKINAKSTTIILDACFSGANIYEKISPILIKTSNSNSEIPNSVIISSSSGTEVSTWYEEKQHGMFTYFFLKSIQDYSLTDKNKDNQLTYQEIFDYISDANDGVPYYARRIHGIEQNPTIQGGLKQNALIRY